MIFYYRLSKSLKENNFGLLFYHLRSLISVILYYLLCILNIVAGTGPSLYEYMIIFRNYINKLSHIFRIKLIRSFNERLKKESKSTESLLEIT